MKLEDIKNLEDLKMAKNHFYGKDSEIALLQKQLKEAKPEEKIIIGRKINELKTYMEEQFKLIAKKIEQQKIEEKIASEWIDVTEIQNSYSSLHPISLISQKLREWFLENGYFEVQDSEIEIDEYNFERLNIPQNHPARDMQDSLFLSQNRLLRTHNTGISARALEKYKNQAFSQFSIGKVYRNDEDDQTHSHQFMQVDFVSIGYVNFPNLIWTLKSLLSYVFETDVEIRLRPSYFPFTEPSVEVDVFYKGRWIEILGAGILNQKVLKMAGYTNDMNGLAAGIGIERLAMIKYEINDIRELYKNDLRFLNQFK